MKKKIFPNKNKNYFLYKWFMVFVLKKGSNTINWFDYV